MLLSWFSETSLLWPVSVFFIFTTSNSTSPLGLVVGLVLAVRPRFLSSCWSHLVLSTSTLTLTGLILL